MCVYVYIFYLNVLQRASITEEAWNNEGDKMSQLAIISYPQPNVGTQWAQEWRRWDGSRDGRRAEKAHTPVLIPLLVLSNVMPASNTSSPRWHHPSKIHTDVDNLRPLSHWKAWWFIFIETNTYSRHGRARSAAVASVNPIWGLKEILIHW